MALRVNGVDLCGASNRGMTETVEALLERGAEVDGLNEEGRSALMAACWNGHAETAKLLLNRGATVDLQDDDGLSALMLACQKGHAETAKLLLNRGATVVDLQDDDGLSALMLACQKGHAETAKLLLNRGATVDLQDDDGLSALMLACQKGHADTAKLLLDRGATLDLQEEGGWSALVFACQNGHTEAAKLLLDRGATLDLQEENGWSALMIACQNGHTEAAKLLLDRGAKVDLQEENGWSALMIACQNGHAEAAKLLLDRGATMDLQKSDGWSALMLACLEGHLEAAKLLLDRGAKVDLQEENGLSALMLACHKGHADTAKLLLDRGATMDLQKSDGWSALMLACLEGHLEAAKLLLDRGATLDLQEEGGWSALVFACQNGHTEAAKLLLDRGAKVDLQEENGWSALMIACQNGHAEAAKLLLDRGATMDLHKSDGWSALMLACLEGHLEAAKLLLDRGAKVDLQEENGWSALMIACQNGHAEAAKLLLDRGATLDLQEEGGWSALVFACQNGHTEAAKLLLDRGAKVDLQEEDGWSALMIACQNGHAEAAKLLLDRGATLDLQEEGGWSALVFACQNGHTEAAKLLLDRGATLDLQEENGWSALMIACQNGHAEAAKLLLDRGATMDLQKSDGWSALMIACQNGHLEAAKLLLDRGAEVDLQSDDDGETALMVACQQGLVEIVKLLLDHGAKADMQDAEGRTALVQTTECERSDLEQAETDQRIVSIITLLCTESDRGNFADLGGPAALELAKEKELNATAELLDFLSEPSSFAPYGLPHKLLAYFYARNVRTPQAAADLSGPELYFMGLKDTIQRHELMERFRAAVKDDDSGNVTLDALALKVKCARDAHKRGQDAIGRKLEDLHSLLSLPPCRLAASDDFDVASNTLREAKQRLEEMRARCTDDANLVAEQADAASQLASLMAATVSGAFHHSFERLEKNFDPAAAENICRRVWARLSDEPLADLDGQSSSEQDTERACQAAGAAIATWKQRGEWTLARRETEAAVDELDAAVQALGLSQTWFPSLRHPELLEQVASELGVVRDAFEKELKALRDDDPMDKVHLAEIRCALELIVRRHAHARQTELARCRAAAQAMQTEVEELVTSCSAPSITAVEGLIDRIDNVQFQRDELIMRLRHARGRRPRAGANVNAEELANLEDALANLPSVYKLDRELRRERARVIRHAELYSPKLLQDPAWREQIGLSSEALIGVGGIELWLASVTRADFAQVTALAIRPGKEVYKVTDPDGRVLVLKSFHLADDSWQGRFYRQVQALAELKSAYLVHIEALFLDASFGCILMPYYEGGDLAAWIRDNPHASGETRKRIAVGVLSGVHELHQRNLVHCDIKPENIFLTRSLTPVLGDFDGIQMSDVTMTQPLQTTARYVAPELRADGVSKVTPAVDLFSVGVVLGEIFPAPSGALQDLIGKLQADDPTQRPSALEALGHEAFHTRPMRSCACLICLERHPETEGVCCESDHFVCKSCLGATVRAASQPDANVQLQRDCSMPCVAPGCERELPGIALASAVPDEFETLLKIVREHFERETAADTEKEIRRRVNVALREPAEDRALREHVAHVQNNILTLSCPRWCDTAFVDFDGCCALKCRNSSCAGYICAWCLQDQGDDSDACHAHVARCPSKPPGEADPFFSGREVVDRAWCEIRAARLRAYVRNDVRNAALRTAVQNVVQPLLTADVVGPDFAF